MRSLIAFPCAGDTLIGTLDAAPGTTGLLIVSGGNEIRCGAHRGMALLAQSVSAAGHPVFRYDRRGIGDSTGENGGFLSAQDDLIAAAAAFRAHAPQLDRIVGFGNCDAASTLALFGRDAGIDRLLLANPWTIEQTTPCPLPPRSARPTASASPTPRHGVACSPATSTSPSNEGLRKAAAPSPQALATRVVSAIETWGDGGDHLARQRRRHRASLCRRRAPPARDADRHRLAQLRPTEDQRALRNAVLAALTL